ncbi:short-chain dehydrogenase [Streptomyces sulfonofaciens]|uniref:Short-chain dehydrogenase n=1 Tax=Streptomyces sulfonofaciens TaxID=68272 RepID=A0A919GLJ7_9ACTN|nr:SDR family NAD(P)-dependent oxidoreductase [Streptomyces sulfonofaciens]GHH86732.1 short-chain dehydrogenase [Streptomyces sulfonofaciens]
MSTAPRTVLVTGAASGIGLAVAESCVEGGFAVGAVDVDATALAAVATRLGDRFVAADADVCDETSVASAVGLLADRLGGFDALVNCAGVGGYTGDVTETSPAQWRRVLDVNLTGAYLASRAALPWLRGRPGAAVVHVSSQYGQVGGAGFPAYCAAKAGVIGLTRAMAVDHAPEGIRVNCVCPGPTDTPMLRRSAASPKVRHREDDRVAGRSLLPSPADPARVADVIDFLLGPGAANVTGAVVPVDGGWTAG